jgi:hypothetical protein
VTRESKRAERTEILADRSYDYSIAYCLEEGASEREDGQGFPRWDEGRLMIRPLSKGVRSEMLGTILSGPLHLEITSVRVKVARRLSRAAYHGRLTDAGYSFYLLGEREGGRKWSGEVAYVVNILSAEVELEIPAAAVRVLDPDGFPLAKPSPDSDRIERYLEFAEPMLRGTVSPPEVASGLLASWRELTPVGWLCADDQICEAPQGPHYGGTASWAWESGKRVGTSSLWIPPESPIEGMLLRDPKSGKVLAVRLRPGMGEARTRGRITIDDEGRFSMVQEEQESYRPLLPGDQGPLWILRDRDPSPRVRLLADGDPRVRMEFVVESYECPLLPWPLKVVVTPVAFAWDLVTWPIAMPIMQLGKLVGEMLQ